MEVNQKRAEAAKACFDLNPSINKVHVSDDLKCFPHKNDAVNHARTLKDKSIDVFERDGDEADFDSDESKDLTDEAETIPNHLTASIAHQTNSGADFEKVEKPEPVAPVVPDTPKLNLSGDGTQPETPAAPAAQTELVVETPPAQPEAVVETPTTQPETAPAAPIAQTEPVAEEHKEGLVEKLTHMVDEVEQVLGSSEKAE